MKCLFINFDNLQNDYRVYKVALSFQKMGYETLVIGTHKGEKPILRHYDFTEVKTIYINPKLPLFLQLPIFWLKVFFIIIGQKVDLIYCHDFGPLAVSFLLSCCKRVSYIYDAHEYVPGLMQIFGQKPRWIHQLIMYYEQFFLRRATGIITVSASIGSKILNKNPKIKLEIITNLPLYSTLEEFHPIDLYALYKINREEKIVLYQGGFYNNGLENIIKSFKLVDRGATLLLLGGGFAKESLVKLVQEEGLGDRVVFGDLVDCQELYRYTQGAYLGLCLIPNKGESYYYSTPNKMFEYIMAEIPQISSNFPEMEKVVKENQVGLTIDPVSIEAIAKTINLLINDQTLYQRLKSNCRDVKKQYSWDFQESSFKQFVELIMKNKR